MLKGEGALATLPAPYIPALTLRAGFAALPPASAAAGRVEWVALDYDGGGAAVAGIAPPGTPVRLLIDGGPVGTTRANGQGRFSIVAVDPRRGVAPGAHVIRLETRAGESIERRVEIKAPEVPTDKVYQVARDPSGWAVSWRTPGGGLQTSLVFDPALGGVAR